MDIFVINLQVNHNMSITPIHTVNNNGLRIIATILSAKLKFVYRVIIVNSHMYFLVFISLMKQYEPKHFKTYSKVK